MGSTVLINQNSFEKNLIQLYFSYGKNVRKARDNNKKLMFSPHHLLANIFYSSPVEKTKFGIVEFLSVKRPSGSLRRGHLVRDNLLRSFGEIVYWSFCVLYGLFQSDFECLLNLAPLGFQSYHYLQTKPYSIFDPIIYGF